MEGGAPQTQPAPQAAGRSWMTSGSTTPRIAGRVRLRRRRDAGVAMTKTLVRGP